MFYVDLLWSGRCFLITVNWIFCNQLFLNYFFINLLIYLFIYLCGVCKANISLKQLEVKLGTVKDFLHSKAKGGRAAKRKKNA